MKHNLHFLHWTKHFQPIYWVLALFLFAQTATLIHSEAHHFHEHDAECDIYLGLENQTLDTVIPFSQPAISKLFITLRSPTLSLFYNETITSKARSPPFS